MTHFDLAIIGSGSGNSLITPDWDGKRVAIIDGGIFGGTCLNVGCIPTKMYAYPARLAASAAEARRLGVDAEVSGVRWQQIRDRVFGRIDAISEAGKRYREVELEHVTLYAENVRFTGPRSLVTESGQVIEADQLVVAAGSRPRLPSTSGIDLPQVHTSDTIMRLDELPERVLVVGGGYIAAEFAAIFTGFGSHVTQINRSIQLLRSQDDLVSERFTVEAAQRWDVCLGYELAHLAANDDGSVRARLTGTHGGALRELDADVVLIAAGRIPNTDRLDIDAAGFDLAPDGRLLTDEYQRVLADGVPVEGVWALGDVSSEYQLKHVANHEARIVSHNLVHPESLRARDHRFVPGAVFTEPQIASVGMSEVQARVDAAARGVEIVTAVQEYASTAYGWAMEDTSGFVKLVAEKQSGLLLGAHIMGHEASMIIQPLIQAMSFGLDVRSMARGQYWIHPALTEVVENALLSLDVEPRDSHPL